MRTEVQTRESQMQGKSSQWKLGGWRSTWRKISLGRKEEQKGKNKQGAGKENTAQVEDWKETSLTGDRSREFLVGSTGNQRQISKLEPN